ncbi:uncharacterized protein N7482_009612 [Penicillium canariense]|uniref:Uncharacterized protein n=1 Tax=Penicillium canariense TaxID=189055 RepID=A0A9W9HTK1_9EURO|nr:uncharacterized protein N7482_009612 [Penicillium canariense]KAJ5153134.1 hypothetical protein N7482_009612 [Penicillium canariense]
MMLLLDLPHELILSIWDSLETARDMNDFARTCHYCYDTLHPRLYHYITNHSDRDYPFLWTAKHGPVETLHKLLDAGVDPSNHWTVASPLLPAISYGREDLLHTLLEHGFNPNIKDISEQTPLHHAAIHGYPECARILLDAGADLNSADNENLTPSSWALFRGHANVLALLLDRGATIDIRLIDEESPLGMAARIGRKELVNLLLERNAPVDGPGNGFPGTPLAWAARCGHESIVTQLLEAGADVQATTDEGQNALHWAALSGKANVVALLLAEGVPPDVPDIHGYTALSRACSSRSMNEKVVELLLEANVNIEARNRDGQTPLSIAAVHSKAIMPLMKKGATLTTIDNDGCSPLVMAAREGHAQTVLDLLDGHVTSATLTEHHGMECREGKNGTKSCIDTPDRLNRTPLFLATLYGYEEVVRILLSRGSSAIHYTTNAGRTPLSVARDYTQRPLETSDTTMESILTCLCNPYDVEVDMEKVQLSSEAARHSDMEIVCDSCSFAISVRDTHYHCAICNDNNYDICLECIASGAMCYDTMHVLQHLRMVDGRWTAIPNRPVYQEVLDVAIR